MFRVIQSLRYRQRCLVTAVRLMSVIPTVTSSNLYQHCSWVYNRGIVSSGTKCNSSGSGSGSSSSSSHSVVNAKKAQKEEQLWVRQPSSRTLLQSMLITPINLSSAENPLNLRDWTSYFKDRYQDCYKLLTEDPVAMRVVSSMGTFPLSMAFGLKQIFPYSRPKEHIKVCSTQF